MRARTRKKGASITPSNGQIGLLTDLCAHAARESGLSTEGIQRILTQGGAFQQELLPLYRKFAAPPPEPFEKEEARSIFTYPAAYQPRSLQERLQMLLADYPTLDGSKVSELANRWAKLPEGLELVQVAPKFEAIARLREFTDPFGEHYAAGCLNEALVMLKTALRAGNRELYNWLSDYLKSTSLRLTASVRERLRAFEAATPGDFLVFPMQSGMLWRARSMRRARFKVAQVGQLDLPSYLGAWHLRTHPERIASGCLTLDCGGDEVKLGEAREFGRTPCFCGRGTGVYFFSYDVADVSDSTGPASFVLPE